MLSALVAQTAPAHLRGTAFGVFGLTVGFATLVASLIAGILWDAVSPEASFLAGAGFASLAFIAFMTLRPADQG